MYRYRGGEYTLTMSSIIPTLIWYYYICPREVWLMAHEINPEQDNALIELGRIFHEYAYKREKKEISIHGMKIDLLRKEGSDYIIGEIKKSSRFELSAKMQLAYYLYQLKKIGVEAKGELLIPKEKKKIKVELDEELEKEIERAISHIKEIIAMERPPAAVWTKYCRRCAYRYFCWA